MNYLQYCHIPKFQKPWDKVERVNKIPIQQSDATKIQPLKVIPKKTQEEVEEEIKLRNYEVFKEEQERARKEQQDKQDKIKEQAKKEKKYQELRTKHELEDTKPLGKSVVEFFGYGVPGVGTYQFARDAGNNFSRSWDLFKNGYYRPALGNALQGAANTIFGVGSLLPAVGGLEYYGKQALTGFNRIKNQAALGHELINGNLKLNNLKATTPTDLTVHNLTYQSKPTNVVKLTPAELAEKINAASNESRVIYGHGSGRTNPEPEVFFNDGLRVKNGDINNTAKAISGSTTESYLTSWPHLQSRDVVLLDVNPEKAVYSGATGWMFPDLFPDGSFKLVTTPETKMYPAQTVLQPQSHILYTDPKKTIGVYNTQTHKFLFNPKNNVFSLSSTPSTSFAFFEQPSKLTLTGNSASISLQQQPFIDVFGKEVQITPFQGPDQELKKIALDGQVTVLRHQFSPEKMNQIKRTMGWTDAALAEYQDELLQHMGTQANVEIKGINDGFKSIATHHGNIYANGTANHVLTLNRDRLPNIETVQEATIHELGGHGRTLGMAPKNPKTFNIISKIFPRTAELMKKNQEIITRTLQLNNKGKFFNQFNTSADLEKWLFENNIPTEQWNTYFHDFRRWKYTKSAQETVARGYTGQVFDIIDPNYETVNIQQLKEFFTPESVEKYKKAVLTTSPIIIGGAMYNNLSTDNKYKLK